MFSRILMFSVAVAMTLLISCNTSSVDSKKVVFKSQMDSVSFAIGYDIGRSLKIDSMNFNQDLIAAGMKAGLAGDTSAMTQEDFKNVMLGFQKMFREKQMKAAQAAEGKKGAENKKFLDENGKKEGVKTTASGLQYKVIKEGNGKQPKGEDVVRVNYKGSLLNGKVFDASKEPIEFPVNGVIKGWTEALQLMKEGSKWMLFIPSELAYGAQGAGQAIGPNELLIFEVELLEVKSK